MTGSCTLLLTCGSSITKCHSLNGINPSAAQTVSFFDFFFVIPFSFLIPILSCSWFFLILIRKMHDKSIETDKIHRKE